MSIDSCHFEPIFNALLPPNKMLKLIFKILNNQLEVICILKFKNI
jgi:hypothetical protein